MSDEKWKLFEPGVAYVAQQSFQSLFDKFEQGEHLVFVYDAQSIYHDMLGYFFTDEHGMSRRWDIPWGEFETCKSRLAEWFKPANP